MPICTNCGHECHKNIEHEFNETMNPGHCSKGDGCECQNCEHEGEEHTS